MTKQMSILKTLRNAKNRRQVRLLRGMFSTSIKHLSDDLRFSAMNEFERIVPYNLPY